MDTTRLKFKELREENQKLKDSIKEIIKLIKNEPYSHNEKVFDITAHLGIHENFIN